MGERKAGREKPHESLLQTESLSSDEICEETPLRAARV